ncbi:Arginyl-tRNA synthetase, class Ic isoform 1 [Hibiscus syriacus]|uniref:Arginyl-tRNA synthetase, class Ic isoform 1 n=1 Tax=Hibiscus syriacus TaxID=106335 RepID=A0A6A2WGS3_HIBSY|nr:Arginyl-tRNA synthetase, class Ic isoform 1 [Hibiscus syriacus]
MNLMNEGWGCNLMFKQGDNSLSIESFIGENSSENSISSISLSDLVEEASSATSSLSSSNGPLYELSDLMAQLPIRRGLSKHYRGKSQSFTSLARVMSIEDVPKRVVNPLNNRGNMKSCKSYGWELDGGQRSKSYSPKATISKKGCYSRTFFMSSLGKTSSNNQVISEK